MFEKHDARDCDPCMLLNPALDIAIEAGRAILEIYESGFQVESKQDNTPLTEADLAAHEIIENGLRKFTPDLPVITEESGKIPFEERKQWHRYWLVDPLDGTREFIRRSGEFTVNVALIENQEPVLGIVYAPVLGTYYYACRGQGAYKRVATGQPTPIHARRWDGGKATVVCSSATHKGKHLQSLLDNLGDYEVVCLGSALKSCLVAEGKADIYARLGPTSEWDTAAAQCIVEEAGGQITDTHMQPLRYNTKKSLLNPHFLVFGETDLDWSAYL